MTMVMHIEIFFLIFVCFTSVTDGAMLMGPYDLDVFNMSKCPNVGTDEFEINLKMNNHKRENIVVTGFIYMPWGLDDSTKCSVSAASFKDGIWKENAFYREFGGVCTALKIFAGDIAKQLFHHFEVHDCPGPGNYTLRRAKITISLSIPVLVYGRWRVDLGLIRNGSRIGCLSVFGNIMNKYIKRNKGARKKV